MDKTRPTKAMRQALAAEAAMRGPCPRPECGAEPFQRCLIVPGDRTLTTPDPDGAHWTMHLARFHRGRKEVNP